MGSLKKLNTEIPYDPPYLLALKSKESEAAQHRDTMLCLFMHFHGNHIIGSAQTYFRGSLEKENVAHVCDKAYLAIKKNYIMYFGSKWMRPVITYDFLQESYTASE